MSVSIAFQIGAPITDEDAALLRVVTMAVVSLAQSAGLTATSEEAPPAPPEEELPTGQQEPESPKGPLN